jgi:aminoglycoside 6'-N-acetyltransferase
VDAFSSLRTERLIVDRLGIADVPAIVGYRNDPDVAEFQAWPMPYTDAHARQLVGYTPRPGDDLVAGGQLAIRLGPPPVLIGDLMVQEVAGSPGVHELGITVGAPWQGKGYAREALQAVIGSLLADRRVSRLVAYVQTTNAPSLVLFDRLGFRRMEVLRGSITTRAGESADEVAFGLTRPV